MSVSPAVDEAAAIYLERLALLAGTTVDAEPEAQLTTPVALLLESLGADAGLALRLVREVRLPGVRPDFAVLLNERPTGWVELKAPSKSVDGRSWRGRDGRQWERLRELDGLLVCNGRQAQLFSSGEPVGDALSLPGEPGWDPRTMQGVLRTLVATRPVPVRRVSELATRLAPLARMLRERLLDALRTAPPVPAAVRARTVWSAHVHTTPDDSSFSNEIAQVITYALAIAALRGGADRNADGLLTLDEAREALRAPARVLAAALGPVLDVEGLLDVIGPELAAVERLFAYAYAVLAGADYVERFADALETPGPRLPLTLDPALFAELAEHGEHLLWLHTFAERFRGNVRAARLPRGRARWQAAVTVPPRTLEDVRYDAHAQELHIGNGLVSGVSSEVWAFSVSGLQVLRKWLGYRTLRGTGRAASSASPLDALRPDGWQDEWNDELLDLIECLTQTVALLPIGAQLLERVMAGQLLEGAQLPPVAQELRRPGAAAGPEPAPTDDAEDLDAMEETLEILADDETMRALTEAHDDLAHGRVSTAEDLAAAMARRAGRAMARDDQPYTLVITRARHGGSSPRRCPNRWRSPPTASSNQRCSSTRSAGKRLRPPMQDDHSARRGDYRVIYRIDEQRRTVIVLSVSHRRVAYRA